MSPYLKGHILHANSCKYKALDIKFKVSGVPVMVQWKRTRLGTMMFVGLIPGLAQWLNNPVLL